MRCGPVTARQRMEARRRTQAAGRRCRWVRLRREAQDKLHAWWFDRVIEHFLAGETREEAEKLSLADIDMAINYLRSRG